MIHFIGSSTSNNLEIYGIQSSTFEEFVEWENIQLHWQLDMESNVVPSIIERKMTVCQFGSIDGTTQWVISVAELTNKQANLLLKILDNPLKQKLIHNAVFEYTLTKKYGVQLQNIWDTLLMDKIIWSGYEIDKKKKKGVLGFFTLAKLTERYLFKTRDKGLQTSFDKYPFSPAQIIYAADDVLDLGHIMRLQKTSLKSNPNQEYVAALENEVVKAFAENSYNGMNLNQEAWRANIDLADPIIEEASNQLSEFLKTDEFRSKVIELGYLSETDSLNINWNSTLQKKLIFNYLLPSLEGITQPIIKKYIKSNPADLRCNLLQLYLDKEFNSLNTILIAHHREWLVEQDLLVPANTVTISWTSRNQVISVFKIIYPNLTSVSKESLADCNHPIIKSYHEFLNTTKLKTTYGEKFIEEHVDSDGKVRTNYNQIINTGRCSSFKPNLTNIPAKGSIGARYRNCFTSDPGWLVCSSDYASQELILIAFFSQDRVWLDALNKGKDLHSTVAEIVYKDKWRDAAEEGCLFYKKDEEGNNLNLKCSCKKHKQLRELIKTINYMLCYGGGPKKFAGVAGITIKEAKQLIKEYFEAFPDIKKRLDAFASFGVRNGFIVSAQPFYRKRYFDYWEGNQHDSSLMSQISRASQNSPLQSSAADQMKVAMCLMYWKIADNNWWDKVKLVSVIHDESLTHVREDFAKEWEVIMNDCMEEATTLTLPKGLLKADTGLSGNAWTK